MRRISGTLCPALVRRVLILVALIAAAAPCALAQFESATILGTVTDSSDAAVSGATVTLINLRTEVSAQTRTDNNGNYQFVNLRLGTYRRLTN